MLLRSSLWERESLERFLFGEGEGERGEGVRCRFCGGWGWRWASLPSLAWLSAWSWCCWRADPLADSLDQLADRSLEMVLGAYPVDHSEC